MATKSNRSTPRRLPKPTYQDNAIQRVGRAVEREVRSIPGALSRSGSLIEQATRRVVGGASKIRKSIKP